MFAVFREGDPVTPFSSHRANWRGQLVQLVFSGPGSGNLARPGGTAILAVIITNAYIEFILL